jgi:hypothetical protein
VKNKFTLLSILVCTAGFAQTTMNIYQHNGPVLSIPVSTIDSITYTTATLPVLSTTAASSVMSTTAISGGNITSDGGDPVTARGIAFDTAQSPTIANQIASAGSGTGTFAAYLTNLIPGTTYYARAYATNSIGTAYGNQISFQTDTSSSNLTVITIPDTVMTDVYYHQTSYLTPVKLVFPNLKKVNGYVYFHQTNNIEEVEFPVLQSTLRYFYFHGNINMKKISAPSLDTVGAYYYVLNNTSLQLLNTCALTDIMCDNQEPYIAISGNTPAVDNIQPCFNATLHGTTLTTTPITNFSNNTAIAGGTFTNVCGTPMHGICWSTSPNPTVNDFTANGSGGFGTFSANMTGLTPNTTYYVRAFSDGGVYGNQVSFTTLP